MFEPSRDASPYNAGWGFAVFIGSLLLLAGSLYALGFLLVSVAKRALGHD